MRGISSVDLRAEGFEKSPLPLFSKEEVCDRQKSKVTTSFDTDTISDGVYASPITFFIRSIMSGG